MSNLKAPLFSPISIAPMIDWTYVHFRVLMRIMAPNVLLYTEMQTTGAIEHNAARALDYHLSEHPLALQIGGADKPSLIRCAKLAEDAGFSEININLGCPSDRVQAGRFGACLMAEPAHVADCIMALKSEVKIPVTVKTRIGIDHHDSYEFFSNFAHTMVNAGCDKLIVHARKAWLKGLSPKQNRTVPPIQYDYVYQIKNELNHFPVIINGDIHLMDAIRHHLQNVDGVMLGRLACQNPYKIAFIHHELYPESLLLSRADIYNRYIGYVLSVIKSGEGLGHYIKPILNLTHGLPGARAFREQLVMIQRSGNVRDLMKINIAEER